MNDALKAKITARASAPAEQSADGTLNIRVPKADLHGLFLFLRDDCGFDYLVFMTALDRKDRDKIELVYRLFSYATNASLVVRSELDRATPQAPTISDIYPTSEWHEREAAEMFGIGFTNHPDPRKLLLPDGFTGFPLRKDFTHDNLIPLPEVK